MLRPAPAWAWWGVVLFVCGCFGVAWWAFAFPLTYCDSPAWAPAYLSRLLGTPVAVASRGALVPAWFELWGALSLATGAANLIGLVQALTLLSAVLAVLVHLRSGMTMAELLVLPAFALSGLRHAIYSQTILSESLVIALGIPVALFILRDTTPSLRRSALMGGLAGLAAGARIESLILLGFVLARLALDRTPWHERSRRLGIALGAGLGALGLLSVLAPPEQGAPLNKSAVVAEWMRFTEPPHTALARVLHFDLVERLGAATSGVQVRDVWDGLAPSRRIFTEPGAPGWPEILRLMAYQAANRPLVVFPDRLGTLADLYASGYAAFWPRYRPWSKYYAPYDQVFARWSADDFQQLRISCSDFARAQAAHYRHAALRSTSAFRVLQALHAGAEPYARWVLRLLYWAAVPPCLVLVARGSGGRSYAWLTLLVLSQLAARAAFTYPDERYQLPVDLLCVAWLALTLRYSLRASPAIASPVEAPEQLVNLRTKQRLDWVVGGVFIAVLRPLVLVLGKLLRRDHALRVGPRVCLFKLLGGGSLVIAFPALLGLRERYPNSELSLLCTKSVAPFAATLRIFDRLIVIDDSNPLRLLGSGLRAWRELLGTDTVIDLEVYSRLSTVFTLLTCARNRLGFYLESAFWRRGLHTHLIFFNRFSGSYLFYEKLVELLGAKAVSVEACRRHLLAGLPAREPTASVRTVCIGGVCSDMGRERMLAPEHWRKVILDHERAGEMRRFVFLGGSTERPDVERILSVVRDALPHHAYENRCGELTLSESLSVLAGANEFWGIDSGLLHYARLLRVPCLSFWGPTHPDSRLKPIPGLDERVTYRKVPCSPCIHLAEQPPCGGNNVCIRNLFESKSDEELEWCSIVSR